MQNKDSIVLAGGCFWCIDAIFRHTKGVSKTTSGYTGGKTENPTYYDVAKGGTGHAEAVKVEYDAKIISLEDIMRIFFSVHNPTTLNRQGGDIGTQYRSVVFYNSKEQKEKAEKIIKEITDKKLYKDRIITKLEPLKRFWLAEEEHQNYYQKNPERAYCEAIINPKLKNFRASFTDKLR